MITSTASRARRHAVGSPLERGVRQRTGYDCQAWKRNLPADSGCQPLRAGRRLCATCSSRLGCTRKAWCSSRRPDKLKEKPGYPRSERHRTAARATDHWSEPPHGLDYLALPDRTAGQVGRGCRKKGRWRPGSQHWYVTEKNTTHDRLSLGYGLPVHWLLCKATTF